MGRSLVHQLSTWVDSEKKKTVGDSVVGRTQCYEATTIYSTWNVFNNLVGENMESNPLTATGVFYPNQCTAKVHAMVEQDKYTFRIDSRTQKCYC